MPCTGRVGRTRRALKTSPSTAKAACTSALFEAQPFESPQDDIRALAELFTGLVAEVLPEFATRILPRALSRSPIPVLERDGVFPDPVPGLPRRGRIVVRAAQRRGFTRSRVAARVAFPAPGGLPAACNGSACPGAQAYPGRGVDVAPRAAGDCGGVCIRLVAAPGADSGPHNGSGPGADKCPDFPARRA
jgi:hypothetical protein